MDNRVPPAVVEDERGRKMGVSGGRRCASCGVLVHWRVEKFCLQDRRRFGGQILCMRCQTAFRRASLRVGG